MMDEQWFKMEAGLAFKTALARQDAETFRVFVLLQCALAHKRSQTITEQEFVPYAPVRSWRVYVKKLADAGLVVWDREAKKISVPMFSEMNTGFQEGRLQYTKKSGRKRTSELQADTEYEYDCEYVDPMWLDDVADYLETK